MKVIVPVSSIRYPLTGIGRYTYELTKHLTERYGRDNIKYFNGRRFVENLEDAALAESYYKDSLNALKKLLIKIKPLVLLYQLVLPQVKRRYLNKFADHIYHSPNYYLPIFKGKSVVTIHDLSVFSWTWCHPPERVRILQAEIKQSLKRASLLITDSEFIKQELVNFFGYSPDKIKVIHLAATAEFKPRLEREAQSVLAKYNLDYGSYSLYVGTIEPRKNIGALLEAYERLSAETRKEWPLLIVGHKGWKSEDIHTRMQNAAEEGWLKYLGYVEAEDLPCIYAAARLFVFPSHYEGFGLPVLEAMASGVPVVCSNASSLPEVVGDAAAMCDPKDVEGLSELIANGLNNGTWRKNAIKKGLLQSKKFSWERCAEETAKVYQELIDSKD
jgi:glycosyltransferase involved in cell wall biosynthesis